jgi:hypothetical protein
MFGRCATIKCWFYSDFKSYDERIFHALSSFFGIDVGYESREFLVLTG